MDVDEMYNVDYVRENRDRCARCIKYCSHLCGAKRQGRKKKITALPRAPVCLVVLKSRGQIFLKIQMR